MKIICYCQHVLGIGHFHRSLAICRELATHHEVTLVVGGPPVDTLEKSFRLFQLPGLQMDKEFKNLAPCDPGLTLEEVKQARCDKLFSLFEHHQPDLFLVELYPFGRKAFRFELDPILQAIRDGQFGRCRSYVSLRDILVERVDDREKFEHRAVTTLNRYFHGLLIHADEGFITLDETFGRYDDIAVDTFYTGFITPEAVGGNRAQMRKDIGLQPDDKLIVVSVGGGNVGSELLINTVEAFRLLDDPSASLQMFTGPYCSDTIYHSLQTNLPPRVRIERFTPHFADWLQAADLSISMAGYNTCMNLAQAGVPSLIYPFAQNREQSMRASRLARQLPFTLLDEEDLAPARLTLAIKQILGTARVEPTINLSGARATRIQLEKWQKDQ